MASSVIGGESWASLNFLFTLKKRSPVNKYVGWVDTRVGMEDKCQLKIFERKTQFYEAN
jgi:hypothetical protein